MVRIVEDPFGDDLDDLNPDGLLVKTQAQMQVAFTHTNALMHVFSLVCLCVRMFACARVRVCKSPHVLQPIIPKGLRQPQEPGVH